MIVEVRSIVRETPKAYFVDAETTSGFQNVWVPKSKVDFISSDMNMLEVPNWLARKKGFVERKETFEDLMAEMKTPSEEEDGNAPEYELAAAEARNADMEELRKAVKDAQEALKRVEELARLVA